VLAVLAVGATTLLGGGVAAAELLEWVHGLIVAVVRGSRAGGGCWVLGAGWGDWVRMVIGAGFELMLHRWLIGGVTLR
jgi:hypothetical protein